MTDVVRPPVQGDIRIKGPFLEPRSKGNRHYFHYGTDFGPQNPGVAGDEVVAPVDGTLVHDPSTIRRLSSPILGSVPADPNLPPRVPSPPLGGLLRWMQEWIRNNPDGGAR